MDCRIAARSVQAAACAGLLLVASGARAQNQTQQENQAQQQNSGPEVTVIAEGGEPHNRLIVLQEDDEGYRRYRQEPLFVGLDFLLGFGNYQAVDEILPTSEQITPSYAYGPVSQIRTETFLLLGHYRFKHFGIGVRMPIVVGHVSSPDAGFTASDVYTNGNLELSLDMPHRISPQIRYIPQIALTLPISQGSTPPPACWSAAGCDASTTQSQGDQYAHYAVGLAAANARGGEDDALFFNWRLGITPKVTFDMKFNHTKIQPYVKIPIMFSMEQNPGYEEILRLEAVGGVRVAQEIGPIQLGVRVVGMIPIAARTSLKTPMLSVWPEVRLQITSSARFWLSGMIPLAGDYNVFNDGQNGAFQAGLSATF